MVLNNQKETDAIVFDSNKDTQVSRNFHIKEYQSKCGSHHVLLHPALILGVQSIRDAVKFPIKINSGYRTIGHNARIGGAPNSYHTKGMAADLSGRDLDAIYQAARQIGMMARKYTEKGFVHVDVGPERNW